MAQKEKIVLPALVFDTLHFASLVFGGVGGGSFNDMSGNPNCIHGMAHAVMPQHGGGMSRCIENAGLDMTQNDTITRYRRIPWARNGARQNGAVDPLQRTHTA